MFSILLSVTLVACKKENISKNQTSTGTTIGTSPLTSNDQTTVSPEKSFLVIKSVDAYEALISSDEVSKKEFLNSVEEMPFTTHNEVLKIEKSTLDLIGSEFLSSILNKDLVVQIGDYLYKINPESHKVFVLPAINAKEYSDLVNENKLNPNVRQFSTDDNVLELAVSGAKGEKALICKDTGVGTRHSDASQNMGTQIGSVYTDLAHTSLGIYFFIRLKSTLYQQYSATFKYEFSSDANERTSRTRCGSWQTLSTSLLQDGYTYTNIVLRESATNYNKYNIKVRCNMLNSGTNYAILSTSSWMQIRANL